MAAKEGTAPTPARVKRAAAPSEDNVVRFDPEAYNAVAKAADLLQLALIESTFKRSDEYFKFADDDVDRHFAGEMVKFQYDADSGFAAVDFEWKTKVVAQKKTLVSMKAVYRVFYHQIPNVEPAAVEAFVAHVCRFTTYPYFRAHVSHAAWEGSLDLPIMPVISSNR